MVASVNPVEDMLVAPDKAVTERSTGSVVARVPLRSLSTNTIRPLAQSAAEAEQVAPPSALGQLTTQAPRVVPVACRRGQTHPVDAPADIPAAQCGPEGPSVRKITVRAPI